MVLTSKKKRAYHACHKSAFLAWQRMTFGLGYTCARIFIAQTWAINASSLYDSGFSGRNVAATSRMTPMHSEETAGVSAIAQNNPGLPALSPLSRYSRLHKKHPSAPSFLPYWTLLSLENNHFDPYFRTLQQACVRL